MRMTPSTPVTKPPTLACHARTRPDSGRGLGGGAGERSLTVTVSVEYDVWLVSSCS